MAKIFGNYCKLVCFFCKEILKKNRPASVILRFNKYHSVHRI